MAAGSSGFSSGEPCRNSKLRTSVSVISGARGLDGLKPFKSKGTKLSRKKY